MATLLFAVAAHAATDPADRCTAAKIKAAGKKIESKLKCQAGRFWLSVCAVFPGTRARLATGTFL